MDMEKINIESVIRANSSKVWKYWTEPEHIVNWNFASDEWCCPKAENELKEGGEFSYTMAAKDNSMSFDFKGVFSRIDKGKQINYLLGDGRTVEIQFIEVGDHTKVIEVFEAEKINSLEMQKSGWQAILDNFKKYVEL